MENRDIKQQKVNIIVKGIGIKKFKFKIIYNTPFTNILFGLEVNMLYNIIKMGCGKKKYW